MRRGRLVELDAEAGTVGHGQRAVDDGLSGRSSRPRPNVDHAGARHGGYSIEADRRHGGGEVQVGRQRDRTGAHVRNHADAEAAPPPAAIASRRRQAAAGRRVGLQHVELAAAHRVDRVVDAEEVLAVGDRHRRDRGQRLDAGAGALRQRLLEPDARRGRAARRATRCRRRQREDLAAVDHQLDARVEQRARSDASVSRSRRHSGPTRTLTFVTPWASSGVEQFEVERRRSLFEEHARRVHLDLVAHRCRAGRTPTGRRPGRGRPTARARRRCGRARRPSRSPRRRRVNRRIRSASGSTAATGCPMSNGANTSSTTSTDHGRVRAAVAVAGLAVSRRRPCRWRPGRTGTTSSPGQRRAWPGPGRDRRDDRLWI